MSNKITQFFKKLSLSQLPRASSENELLASQDSALSSAAAEVEAESQNSPIDPLKSDICPPHTHKFTPLSISILENWAPKFWDHGPPLIKSIKKFLRISMADTWDLKLLFWYWETFFVPVPSLSTGQVLSRIHIFSNKKNPIRNSGHHLPRIYRGSKKCIQVFYYIFFKLLFCYFYYTNYA